MNKTESFKDSEMNNSLEKIDLVGVSLYESWEKKSLMILTIARLGVYWSLMLV